MNIQTDTINGNKPLGFGDHACPVLNPQVVDQAKRIYQIALYVLIGAAVVSAIALSILCPLIPVVTIPCVAGAATFVAFNGAYVLYALYKYKAAKDASIGITNSIKVAQEPVQLGISTKCDVIATKDGPDTFVWKKKLIASAQHNIVISGSYCGGNSFDEALALIEKQLEEKPELKVLILNADKFTNEENKKGIHCVASKYPQRFQVISTPDIWIVNPGLKRSTNHAKVFSVDYGEYFIIGGSSLEDKHAYTRGLGTKPIKTMSPNTGWLGNFIASSFRDKDFVFHNIEKNGIGKRVYLEALKLAWRWESLERDASGKPKGLTVTAELLDEQVEGQKEANSLADIQEFHKNNKMVSDCDTTVLCSGPEHTKNVFEEELIKRINEAKNIIAIDHLYFHPSENVFKAFVNAANRGVKIQIVTNGYQSGSSPAGHKLFGPRSRYNIAKLLQGIKSENRANVDTREFVVNGTSLHTKVIVVDDYVIAGSSNIGYKSLVTMSDHEINFVVKNQALADHALQDIQINANYAKEISAPEEIAVSTALIAAFHRALAPLLG